MSHDESPQPVGSVALRYVVAILGTAIAILTRYLLPEAVSAQFPFALFFLAVLFAAWLGGYGPAYVAVIMGTVYVAIVVMPSERFSWPYLLGMELFVMVGIGIAQLSGMMHRTVEQLKQTLKLTQAMEQRRSTRLRVNEILASSSDPDEATQMVLQTICQGLNWQVGAIWMVDSTGNHMRCMQIYDNVGEQVSEFTAVSETITLTKGIGLPGHIWKIGEPKWIENVANDSTLPRAGIAKDAGLKGAFGFPLLSEGRVIGAVEFLSHEVRRLDADLLEMFGALGNQIGHFLERHRVEEALQQSEKRFSRFMVQLPGLAWMKDLEGRYVFANNAAEEAFGRPCSDLYGKTDIEIFPPETAEQFQQNDQAALLSENGVQVVETLEHADGIHYSLVSKFPIVGANNQVSFVGGMAIDISDRLKAEEALKESNRLKDEFLAMLAHELRNPLAPIRNALMIMKKGNLDAATLEEVRETAERQAQHMGVLLDDLLDIARITKGHIELQKEEVDLTDLLDRTIHACQHLMETRGHELAVSLTDKIVVDGDPHRLEQIFTNLLNNSSKYTDPEGHISVSSQVLHEEAVIRVQDSGIGIAPEMLPHIFDPFVQAERRIDRSQGGIGIGLTLVKQLVELHGGSISAESPGLNQGSTFTVRLPILHSKPIEPASLPECQHEEPALCTRRILIVDDNCDAAATLKLLLKSMGQDVRTANDGPAALAVVDDFKPELVLLDIGMPGMDGYEVARRMRQMPPAANTVLVALTGWGQEKDRQQSREAGFDHHLVKPIDMDKLEELLAN